MFVLCLLTLLAGRLFSYPAHAYPAGMAMCDDLPCMMNITVGVTEWETVPTILTAYAPRWLPKGVEIQISERAVFRTYPSIDGVHVGRSFLEADASAPLGWMVQWYGQPCAVSYYPNGNMLVIRYPHTLANIYLEDGTQLTPHTNIALVSWQDPAFENDMQPDLCVDNITDGVRNTPWQGFSLMNYTG